MIAECLLDQRAAQAVTGCNWLDDFLLRTISGALAFVLGTGLAYLLFISPTLQKIEHYKERLRVYKELYRSAGFLIIVIDKAKSEPEWTASVAFLN